MKDKDNIFNNKYLPVGGWTNEHSFTKGDILLQKTI